MNFTCSPQRPGRTFRETKMPYFALCLEFGHSLHRLFYRRVLVNTVLIVQINPISPQTLKTASAGGLDMSRRTIDRHLAIDPLDPKLCGQEDPIRSP